MCETATLDRRPDRATDLLRDVDEARREPGVAVLDAREHSNGHRHERESEPDCGDDEPREEIGPVRPVRVDVREVESPIPEIRSPVASTFRTPKFAFLEQREDQRQCRGSDERGAETLDSA
jgi:hypothetical protein